MNRTLKKLRPLAQESIQGQVAFKHRSKAWIEEQEKLEATLEEYAREIEAMKEVRKAKSNQLQPRFLTIMCF